LRASRVSDLTLSGDRAAELLRCATAASGDQTCFDTPAPETFTVEFDLHSGKSFRIDVNTAWAPEFAQRFLQLVNLGWFQDTEMYRNAYRNQSTAWVTQWGLSGIPAVDAAWTKHKAMNRTSRAQVSNTPGRVSVSMDAVQCDPKLGTSDPCAKFRPNCTAQDYCATQFSTEIYVNYADNSKLDQHGFAPFGEVDPEGLLMLQELAGNLGNTYGEVCDLCPRRKAFCIYKDGVCQGVHTEEFVKQGNKYIESNFPLIHALMRVRRARVISGSSKLLSSPKWKKL